jgi:predicted metal-dependent hydrolase
LSTVSSELTLGGAPLVLRISPRARRLRLRIDPRTRRVLLTVPRRVSQRHALAWAAEHRLWVETALADIPPPAALGPGSHIPFRGRAILIDWDPLRPRRAELIGDRLRIGGPAESLERRILRWLKGEALALLDRESRELAARAGLSITRLGVGDPASRWGSCSASGSIRYSWRLIMAPDFVRQATVAHEVAHLVHLDHGRQFHALVETLLGTDPKPARAWLRGDGASLHRIGRSD